MKYNEKQVKPVVHQAHQAQVDQNPQVLSLADALLTLEYLGVVRKIMCTKCGFRLGTLENSYNRHCEPCRLEQNYTPTKGINTLDKALCAKLDVWVERFLGLTHA